MSTPLSRARDVLKQSFAEIGYDEPIEVIAKTRSGKIVPVPMDDGVTDRPTKLSLKESAVLQTIKAAGKPITVRGICDVLIKSATFVKAALKSLKDRGLIEHVSGDGYRAVG